MNQESPGVSHISGRVMVRVNAETVMMSQLQLAMNLQMRQIGPTDMGHVGAIFQQ